jgi:DNA repair protein RadD
MYGRLIKDLTEINPNIRICGFSATPYRTDSGDITVGENRIFTDVVYEISTKQLIDDGYLCPPVSKSPLVQADMNGVKITAGDYNNKQMAARFDQKEFLTAALDGDMHFFEDRKSIAFFCATVENAEHVAEAMCARGIYTETIDGEMSADVRADKFRRFKSGELRGLASVMVMSVGTDLPNIDCIVMLVATKSPGKYVQIVGRGFRPLYADGYDLSEKEERLAAIANGKKPNFYVIDHGSNVINHGPIINVRPPESRQKGQKSPPPKPKARICEICRTANTLEALICITCGTTLKIERDPTASLSLQASDADIMGTPFSRGEVAEWCDVDDVRYSRHVKADKSESLRVTYYSGILQFDEWRNPRNKSFLDWWVRRLNYSRLDEHYNNHPLSVHQALETTSYIIKPRSIQVIKKGKYHEVLRYKFDEAVQSNAINQSA